MKKLLTLMAVVVIVATVFVTGCKKKEEAPAPAMDNAATAPVDNAAQAPMPVDNAAPAPVDNAAPADNAAK